MTDSLFNESKPFDFDSEKPQTKPKPPSRLFALTCQCCGYSGTYDTNDPASGVCECGHMIARVNEQGKGLEFIYSEDPPVRIFKLRKEK
uniref:Uncharacterized protein n=1 Tax=viral metagenome TaxID=1070528 RepID=A0A6H2A007_9ZZZZ